MAMWRLLETSWKKGHCRVAEGHLALPGSPPLSLSPQPRPVKRGTFGKMATSVSGAITAARLPAQSPVSTPSLWLALCSVWRGAMLTALQVRPLLG